MLKKHFGAIIWHSILNQIKMNENMCIVHNNRENVKMKILIVILKKKNQNMLAVNFHWRHFYMWSWNVIFQWHHFLETLLF